MTRQWIVCFKADARGISMDKLLNTMVGFFACLRKEKALELIEHYLLRLREIEAAVSASNAQFYSSSILFVYDYIDCSRWDCRMIDFVHSHICQTKEGKVIDGNYLEGLRNLAGYFRLLQQHFSNPTGTTTQQ